RTAVGIAGHTTSIIGACSHITSRIHPLGGRPGQGDTDRATGLSRPAAHRGQRIAVPDHPARVPDQTTDPCGAYDRAGRPAPLDRPAVLVGKQAAAAWPTLDARIGHTQVADGAGVLGEQAGAEGVPSTTCRSVRAEPVDRVPAAIEGPGERSSP